MALPNQKVHVAQKRCTYGPGGGRDCSDPIRAPPLCGLIPDDAGKRHLRQNMSETEQFKPSLRYLEPKPALSEFDVARGIRRVGPQAVREAAPQGRRHNVEAMTKSGYDAPAPTLMLDRQKVVQRDDGRRARDISSLETTLDTRMGMKTRVSGLQGRRNGIPLARPGDKPYAAVELSPGFFHQEGGVIPGSSIRPRVKKGGIGGSANLSQTESTTLARFDSGTRLTYQQKRTARIISDDVESVRALTNPSTSITGDEVPSWEMQTGQYTVLTKAERTAAEGPESGEGDGEAS